MENAARNSLDRFLIGHKGGMELGLGEMYEFLHHVIAAIGEEKRWVKYSTESRLLGHSPRGECFPETVLSHVMHQFFLAAEMLAVEKERVGHDQWHVGLKLDAFKIIQASVFYGLGMALHGDVAFMQRSEADLAAETEDFHKIIAFFLKDAKTSFRCAYELSKERDDIVLRQKKPLAKLSLDGQFLWAVVVASFFAKSAAEIGRGNRAFANTFHNLYNEAEYLSCVFISFRQKVDLQLVRAWLATYPRWHE